MEWIILLILFFRNFLCVDFYISTDGTGDTCLKAENPCTFSKAMIAAEAEPKLAQFYIQDGTYDLGAESFELISTEAKFVGMGEKVILKSTTDATNSVFTFHSLIVKFEKINFSGFGRSIFNSSRKGVSLELYDCQMEDGAASFVVMEMRGISNLTLEKVTVKKWTSVFVLHDNQMKIDITIDTLTLTQCQTYEKAPIWIFNSKGDISANIKNMLVDTNGPIYTESSGIGMRTADSITVTLSHSRFLNSWVAPFYAQSDHSNLTLSVDTVDFINCGGYIGGAMQLYAWIHVDFQVKNSHFISNLASPTGSPTGGGAIHLQTTSFSYISTGNNFTLNKATYWGGAVQIEQAQHLWNVPKSFLSIKDDLYLLNKAENNPGGAFWIEIYTLDLKIENSIFSSNQAGIPRLSHGYHDGGVFKIATGDALKIDILGSQFIKNTGQNGGVFHVTATDALLSLSVGPSLGKNSAPVQPSIFIGNRAFQVDCEAPKQCSDGNGGVFFLNSIDNFNKIGVTATFEGHTKFESNSALMHGGVVFISKNDGTSTDIKLTGTELEGSNSENIFLKNEAGGYGGAFYIVDGNDISISNAKFDSNIASGWQVENMGGAIFVDGVGKSGSVEFSAPIIFVSNKAEWCGGAASLKNINSKIRIGTGSQFLGNMADITSEMNHSAGGALCISKFSELEVEDNSIFVNNKAQFGGAMILDYLGSKRVNIGPGASITSNVAVSDGGGIYFGGESYMSKQELDAVSGMKDNEPNNYASMPFLDGIVVNSTLINECRIVEPNDHYWNCIWQYIFFFDRYGQRILVGGGGHLWSSFEFRLAFPSDERFFGRVVKTSVESTVEPSFRFLYEGKTNIFDTTVEMVVLGESMGESNKKKNITCLFHFVDPYKDEGKSSNAKKANWGAFISIVVCSVCCVVGCLTVLTICVIVGLCREHLLERFSKNKEGEYQGLVDPEDRRPEKEQVEESETMTLIQHEEEEEGEEEEEMV